MISRNILAILILTIALSSAQGATIPEPVNSDTCIDLCSSCEGVAEYKDGHCECSISANLNEETECLGRMKRQAKEYGLDLVSCDSNDEARSTRCTLGHKHKYGKNDIEQVAKYFMQDGPMTGSIFIAPPYTHQAVPLVAQAMPIVASAEPILGKSSDCSKSSQTIITQPSTTLPEESYLGSSLITQPKEFLPIGDTSSNPITSISQARTIGGPLNAFGFQNLAPQFLSFLGEVITRPILGLPQAIQSVSRTPGMSQLVGAPANFLNSLADRMAENSKIAKENLDNFREVVGKAKDDVKAGLDDLKQSRESFKPLPSIEDSIKSNSPSYSVMNPQPMLSWLNPTVGAAAPSQLLGSPAPMQFIATAPTPMQFVQAPMMSSAQVVSAVPSQMVSAAAPQESNCAGQQQIVGSTNLANNQMLAAPAPQILSTMPFIQSLGTIPLSSIYSQLSPTYLVGSPMTYYQQQQQQQPAEQTVGDVHESLEEIPLSSPPQKKICKKSTGESSSIKYTRDVKAVEGEMEEIQQVMSSTTTTTTTDLPMIDRTTTQKPKEKLKEDKSVIAKIKPLSPKKKMGERKL